MEAVCIPAGQLKRRIAGPAIGQDVGSVEADREP
jgi:hypothetical protein